jgi:PTS system galactitol-specific IIB component
MRKYRILSACGTGVATSTVAADTCKKQLAERGLEDVEITECKASEIVGLAESLKPDCIIHTAEVPTHLLGGIKTFRCIQYITGVGSEELSDQIADYLKSLD